LVHWIKNDAQPDVVHLSNSMLSGMAAAIKQLGVPVVCTLSGEDLFVEKLLPPHYQTARKLLQQQASEIDRFVALNSYYADFMADYLSVPREKIDVISHGLDLSGYLPKSKNYSEASHVPTIGYLARICTEKGLHLLVAACELLMHDTSVPPFRLRVAGYLGELDRPFFRQLQLRAQGWPDQARFEYVGEVDRAGKLSFLQSLDVFCLPTVYRESKGISAIEALAAGVPVVLPAHGAFPELITATGGGVLHEPENVAAIATAIKSLLLDARRAEELGRLGQQAVFASYTAQQMAEQTALLYERHRAIRNQ
jgi:glycosyltransferase involved in cell wall biosynthesis